MGFQISQSPTSPNYPVPATPPHSGAISTAEIKARMEVMFADRDRDRRARNTI